MIILISLLTGLSVALILYYYVGYPFILRILSKRKKSSEAAKFSAFQPQQQNLPSVTILVPICNEEEFIADKIRNLSILDYPRDKLKIVVVSDGSTDNTYEVVLNTLNEAECRHFDIKAVRFEYHVGKVDVLNSMISTISTDILALSDASSLISIDALQIAVKHFNDPEVGVVNGDCLLTNPVSERERKLNMHQSKIEFDEANIGSMIGSHGAFYLLRRHLYQSLPTDAINDDFIIPMQVVKKGYRSILDSEIHALELDPVKCHQSQTQRHKGVRDSLQQAFRFRALLLPKYGGTAFTFASGKVLHALMPFLVVIASLGCIYLASYSAI